MLGAVPGGELRVFYLGMMSLLIGITTVVMAMTARLGERFTGTDAMDIAVSMSIMGVGLMPAMYRMIMLMVLGESVPLWRIALFAVVWMTMVASVSVWQIFHERVHYVAGEELMFMLGYAALGLCFSVGYAMTNRPTATYDPKTIHLVTD
jgi:hypothetical protein